MNKQIQYTSIKEMASRLLKHPLMNALTIESIVQYTVDFIGSLGVSSIYIDSEVELEIEKFRAKLPVDLVFINQVRNEANGLNLRTNTSSYPSDQTIDTMKIQGSVLYVTFETGKVLLSYKSIPLDEDGMPLIPDNSVFLEALELYIKKQWFTILYEMGTITISILNNIKQDYAWKVGQCNSEFTLPSIAEMESFTNMWNQMIPARNEFRRGFKRLGNKQ